MPDGVERRLGRARPLQDRPDRAAGRRRPRRRSPLARPSRLPRRTLSVPRSRAHGLAARARRGAVDSASPLESPRAPRGSFPRAPRVVGAGRGGARLLRPPRPVPVDAAVGRRGRLRLRRALVGERGRPLRRRLGRSPAGAAAAVPLGDGSARRERLRHPPDGRTLVVRDRGRDRAPADAPRGPARGHRSGPAERPALELARDRGLHGQRRADGHAARADRARAHRPLAGARRRAADVRRRALRRRGVPRQAVGLRRRARGRHLARARGLARLAAGGRGAARARGARARRRADHRRRGAARRPDRLGRLVVRDRRLSPLGRERDDRLGLRAARSSSATRCAPRGRSWARSSRSPCRGSGCRCAGPRRG